MRLSTEELPPKKEPTRIKFCDPVAKKTYVQAKFPKKTEETHVRYTPVGDDHFRIVFFKIRDHNEESIIQDHFVCRTYFVHVERTPDGCKHTVVDQKLFF